MAAVTGASPTRISVRYTTELTNAPVRAITRCNEVFTLLREALSS